jgi:hypothetical protein
MSDKTKDKFTPGPWMVDRLRIIRNGTQPTGLYNVADCADPTAGHIDGNIEERAANAKLIAKAPEMLTALQGLLDTCELNQDDMEDETRTAIRAARDAVRNARGE